VPRHCDAFLDLRTGGWDPVLLTLHAAAQRDPRQNRAVSRIPIERYPREPDRFCQPFTGPFVGLRLRAQLKVVSNEALSRLAPDALRFENTQLRLDRTYDAAGHTILQRESIVERALEALDPDMRTGRRINQLPCSG
jgi:hypothetical protein